MLPNVHHLTVFREVARRGSVTAAAKATFVSQPAATQAVAALERLFRTPLFVRTSAGMRLTPAGQLAAVRIERALDFVREGLAELVRGTANLSAVQQSISVAQLETLVLVVEHNRFAAAARAAHVSRPTVHRAARGLEERVGVRLFERTSFGVQPTREAERLATRVQLAFAELDQGLAEVRALERPDAGVSVVGAMPLARSALVPRAVLEFMHTYPGHAVSILDGPYDSLLAALRVGRATFLVGALRGPAPAPDVVEERLFDDPLALIVRAGHPLAGQTRLSGRTLTRYPWIAPRAGSPLRRHFSEMFALAGVAEPVSPIECNSQVASRALLAGSDRIMLLSALQVQQELRDGQLVALPHPQGVVVRAIGLTLRRGWQPTAAQAALLAAVRHVAARYAQPLGQPRLNPYGG